MSIGLKRHFKLPDVLFNAKKTRDNSFLKSLFYSLNILLLTIGYVENKDHSGTTDA